MSIRDRVHAEASFLARLRRYPRQGWVGGVCAGLADYFDWKVKLIRVLMVLAFMFSGFFPVGVVYLVLWYLMDEVEGAPPHRAYAEPADQWPPAPHRPATMGNLQARFSRLEARLASMEECVSSRDFELRRELRKLES